MSDNNVLAPEHPPPPAAAARNRFGRLADKYMKYIMIIPVTAILAAVAIYPFLFALRLSLTNAKTNNFQNPEWVGISNYVNILTSGRFWDSTILTIIYVGVALSLEIVLGLGLAMLAEKATRGQKWYVSLLITPMLISTVLAGIIFRLELNQQFGVIPYYLGKLGITANLLDTGHALMTMILIDVWQWTSFIFLIAFAGLKSLPVEPFEAARVYGASAWQTFRYVTLPLVKPVLMIAVIFRMMDAFKAFDHIYILTSGGPDFATTTFSVLAYNYAYTTDNFGMASAMAVVLLIIIIIITKRLLKIAKWQ
ncbi:MAG: sugar ABC transporter permease [Desulfobacterales bacterium]|jgi:multiple sugar transport system permease protein